MLILAEFSAGESNTLLFEHVQYVSYCMMAYRQKLRLLCQPGRACLNRSDQVSGFYCEFSRSSLGCFQREKAGVSILFKIEFLITVVLRS